MVPPGNKTASQKGARRDRRKSRAMPHLVGVCRGEIRSVVSGDGEVEANEAGDGLGGGGRRKNHVEDRLASIQHPVAKSPLIMRSLNLC